MNHRFTAWKKSRKYGDIYGGRERLRLSDNIFARTHSLKRPSVNDELPILIEDNPSREFFFPISALEAKMALQDLPVEGYEGITHIWLRRFKKKDYQNQELPLAEFVCGSGVRAIILYPWRRDLIQNFGPKKPSKKTISEYQRFCSADLQHVGGTWLLKWQLAPLRKFCLHILYHEVGHHIDWYIHHWSKANSKKTEEAANQYAFQRAPTAKHVFDQLQKNRREK